MADPGKHIAAMSVSGSLGTLPLHRAVLGLRQQTVEGSARPCGGQLVVARLDLCHVDPLLTEGIEVEILPQIGSVELHLAMPTRHDRRAYVPRLAF
eukprot:scaffold4013_cov429-Prasinococcus_capsulatus_cf.AAC.8